MATLSREGNGVSRQLTVLFPPGQWDYDIAGPSLARYSYVLAQVLSVCPNFPAPPHPLLNVLEERYKEDVEDGGPEALQKDLQTGIFSDTTALGKQAWRPCLASHMGAEI